MAISLEKIQKLREITLASMNDVKRALDEAQGDEAEALAILKKRGKIIAEKKSARETKAGLVVSYIHGSGKIGVLLELKCETDFVAKTEEFKTLARDLALHVTALKPAYVKQADVPASVLEAERAICREQVKDLKKPAQITEQIIEGKIAKYLDEQCLLRQRFVKDEEKTVEDVIRDCVAKVGENIEMGRFARFEI